MSDGTPNGQTADSDGRPPPPAFEPPPTRGELAKQLKLPAHLVDVLCRHLLDWDLLREDKAGGLLPARPPETLTLADVVSIMRHKVGAHWPLSENSGDRIDRLLLDVERAALDQMRAVTWSQLAADSLPSHVARNDDTKNLTGNSANLDPAPR